MAAERDVILDFIHSEHDGEGLCTGYILIAMLNGGGETDELYTYPEPGQNIIVSIGLSEAAAAVLKTRFVKEDARDD